MRLEGIIGKRADAPYRSGRSTDWIKLKCLQRQEFVVGGYTVLTGAKSGMRSLMLGVHERDGSLRFAGTVKAELKPRPLAELEKKAAKLLRDDPPFYNPPPREKDRDFLWLEPELVVCLPVGPPVAPVSPLASGVVAVPTPPRPAPFPPGSPPALPCAKAPVDRPDASAVVTTRFVATFIVSLYFLDGPPTIGSVACRRLARVRSQKLREAPHDVESRQIAWYLALARLPSNRQATCFLSPGKTAFPALFRRFVRFAGYVHCFPWR
jgi:hypothetical protein